MVSEMVKYQSDNGQEITVTEQDIRDLMAANGNATGNVSSQEIKTFMRLCQAQRLNPFTKDAYLVKYGTSPATIIAGKETFTKRAQRNPKFRGFEAGITVLGTDNKLHRREGSMLLKGETIVGGWCKVYIKDYEAPMYDEVSFSEYDTGKSNWKKIPATMIRKVAICHALREAFPEDLGGLYGSEEMDQAAQAEPMQAPRNEPAPPQDEPEVIVEDVPEDVPEDPRRAMWEQTAALKAEALGMGTKEEGIASWMNANIKADDGSPKSMNAYTEDDIARLIDFLALNIENHSQLASFECEEPEDAGYAPEDIPF